MAREMPDFIHKHHIDIGVMLDALVADNKAEVLAEPMSTTVNHKTAEIKMIEETRKTFRDPSLAITTTCIRVPVLRAHSESINLTFEQPITSDEAREILSGAPGIEVVDDAELGRFPMPIDASGRDSILVGRIRQDVSQPDNHGIELFTCGDQLRKGGALNAIQILELIAGQQDPD